MNIKSLAITSVSTALLFSLTAPTFAQAAGTKDSYVIGNEAVSFLKSHHVDVTPFKQNPSASLAKSKAYDESILSLERQVAAYHFSDDQIQNYVKGLVKTTPHVVRSATASSTTSTSTYSAASMPLSTRTDPWGIGYEVDSTSGFNEETAYATIPTTYIASATSGYMFYTVSSPASGSWGIDVGLWYGSGSGGAGWRGVYNSTDLGQHATTGIISALTPGKLVYLQSAVRSDGYLETKVLDGNNFSTVYVDDLYYVGDKGVYTSNAVFNRQITLCQDQGIFTNGSYMNNAKFSQAYLYSNTGYAPVSSTNTVSGRRGAFGSNSTNVNQVTVNSYTQWDSENISIHF